MNVSYRWIREIAPTAPESPWEAAERLTALGAPVDEVVPLARGLEGIVVARVERVRKHPNADRLWLCEVATGNGTVQVVTGAPNVREGAYYPYVGAGGTLPGGVRIERAKLRGEWSEGMLCSERELGLGRDAAGIMQLHGEFRVGTPLVEALGLDDHRLVLDLTANRGDLLGHWGVALELAAGGLRDLRLPPIPGGRPVEFEVRRGADSAAAGVSIRIEDPEGCPRYMGLVVRGVRVGPSPEWLAARLRAVGARPINNVVDATNYVLYELNHPIHAFDLATLRGPAIVVRRARPGERITTLDGEDRALGPEVLVIADAERPVAVAGVMGGAETEVTERTTDVLLECAYFEPRRIRRGARALGLDTDASHRFQRGVDPEGLPRALRRVAELVLAVAGGAVEPPAADACPRPAAPVTVRVRPERVSRLLGVPVDAQEVAELVAPIGFETAPAPDGLEVKVPSWRPDVTREVDVIEEVARRRGYGTFPDELRAFRPGRTADDALHRAVDRIRDLWVRAGFLEARTVAFAPAGEGEVRIANPLSEDEAYLRRWLLPGLVHRVERNFARLVRDVRLFDVATVFRATGGALPEEEVHVAAAFTGRREPPHWSAPGRDFDVWDLKALLEEMAPAVVGPDALVRPVEPGDGGPGPLPLEPGLQFAVVTPDGEWWGAGGRVRGDALDAPPWAAAVWGLELRLRNLVPAVPRYRPLPVYPPVERDLAVVAPRELPAAVVESVLRDAAPPTLEAATLFDVYEGAPLPPDRRSLAWHLRFRAPDRTLRDEEVDAAVRAIVRTLKEKLHVSIRGEL